MNMLQLAEKGLIPDRILRWGIRKRLKQMLHDYADCKDTAAFVDSLKQQTNATPDNIAPSQHYALSPEYFQCVLGARLKDSCCVFDTPDTTLEQAEVTAIAQICERAEIADGQHILDLGCGWGSFSLYVAEHFPQAHITAVSHSRDHGTFIRERCGQLGLNNVHFIHQEMDHVEHLCIFDRIVLIERIQHAPNLTKLLKQIETCLKPEGAFFVQNIAHQALSFPLALGKELEWLQQYFFMGKMMPSASLLYHFQDDLKITQQWILNGIHYQKTADAWLKKHDQAHLYIHEKFAEVYGESASEAWFHRWRIFYLICSELFGFQQGHEWLVAQYLLRR
jgi:cyclopropane-fatty-acyl-phospholipid synthase